MIEVINANARTDAESGEYEMHFEIRPGSLVLDLGAHAGHFSELACGKGAFVIAFEPHPVNFHWLGERLKGLAAVAVNRAAWGCDGKMLLHECPANTGAHSLFRHDGCSDTAHEVGTVDIGAFLKKAGIRPDFIKIDTEGAEFNILTSLFLNGIKVGMAIECHDHDLYARCRELALDNGMKWLPEESHVGVCYCLP